MIPWCMCDVGIMQWIFSKIVSMRELLLFVPSLSSLASSPVPFPFPAFQYCKLGGVWGQGYPLPLYLLKGEVSTWLLACSYWLVVWPFLPITYHSVLCVIVLWLRPISTYIRERTCTIDREISLLVVITSHEINYSFDYTSIIIMAKVVSHKN